jgi:hypothetical protein
VRRVDRIELTRHALRRGPWAAIGGVALTLGAVNIWRAVDADSVSALVPWLRLTAVMFGAAVAASVEDVAAAVAWHTPFGRFRRRLLGVALPCAAVVVLWLLIAAAGSIVAGDGALPIGGLLVEVVGLSAANGVAARVPRC